jgi:hypothetical protein
MLAIAGGILLAAIVLVFLREILIVAAAFLAFCALAVFAALSAVGFEFVLGVSEGWAYLLTFILLAVIFAGVHRAYAEDPGDA